MKPHLLERLKMDRLHVAPRTLDLSPVHLRERFRDIWAPLEELARRLRPLPAGLVRYWLAQRGGHAIIVHHPSRYEVGEQPFGSQSLHNVAYVSLSDLASDSIEALVAVGNLLDHLLGSGGKEDPWLSSGGGTDTPLREVGARIAEYFPLGYGFDKIACADPNAYFARSLAQYLYDRRSLNAADPLIEKLLRQTLLSDAFWR